MPHRIPTTGRYKISNDVLILILENLDPTSLYRTYKTFDRVRYLVKQFHHLRYKYELALGGMTDGALAVSKRPPNLRLQVLSAYRKDWPRLHWTAEQRVNIPVTATLGSVTGDFIFFVAGQTLDLMELPSIRLNRLPAQTHHLRFNINPAPNAVAIDHEQSLIVVGHALTGPGGELGIRLRIRNLWNFEKHRLARDSYFDCISPVAQPLEKLTLSICGNKIAISLVCSGAVTKQLLLNWNTFQAMWMEEHDIHFVKADYLLGAKVHRGRAIMNLYNISNLGQVIIEREYELPKHWAGARMAFAPNVALTGDSPSPLRALFYADANSRVLLLSAQQSGGASGKQWLIMNESYFRPTSRPDRHLVLWEEWRNYCLVKSLPPFASIQNVQVVGNRVLFLETTPTAAGREQKIGLIEFPAYPDPHNASAASWTHIGPRSVLIPYESFKEIPSRITKGVNVESIAATEDNIILFLEPHHDAKAVHLMTFGVSTS